MVAGWPLSMLLVLAAAGACGTAVQSKSDSVAMDEDCSAALDAVRRPSLLQRAGIVRDKSTASARRLDLDRYVLATLGYRGGPEMYDALSKELMSKLQEAHPDETLEGNTGQAGVEQEQRQYDEMAKSEKVHTICETGFNAGHSALRFLAESQSKIFEFDLGSHGYSRTAAEFLRSRFPDRLSVTWGDSTKTLPEFHRTHQQTRCDILIVDGAHDYDVAMSDLKNFAQMAAPGHTLVIDDTPCNGFWCVGPTQAWKELVQNGCITETESVPMGADRGFSVGRFTPCAHLA